MDRDKVEGINRPSNSGTFQLLGVSVVDSKGGETLLHSSDGILSKGFRAGH